MSDTTSDTGPDDTTKGGAAKPAAPPPPAATKAKEYGGPAGPEPTRYGDWEQKGRCTDF